MIYALTLITPISYAIETELQGRGIAVNEADEKSTVEALVEAFNKAYRIPAANQ